MSVHKLPKLMRGNKKDNLTHPFAKARAGSTSNSACRTIPPDNGIKALISAMLKTGPQASIPTNLTTREAKKSQ